MSGVGCCSSLGLPVRFPNSKVFCLHSPRVLAMLYLHRSFFAQAMLDFPSNPLRSPFAPSFLAAYRCASAIIKTTAMNFQKYPELFSRFWTMWSHLLSAAVSSPSRITLHELMSSRQVIVGTIATRAPSSAIAPAAQLELDLALNLFRSGAAISPRAKSGLVGCDFAPMRRASELL